MTVSDRATSVIYMNNGEVTKTAFNAYRFFDQAHTLPSGQRWLVANSFFQMFDKVIGRSASAVLANDWSNFGYKEYSLAEYVAREIKAQNKK